MTQIIPYAHLHLPHRPLSRSLKCTEREGPPPAGQALPYARWSNTRKRVQDSSGFNMRTSLRTVLGGVGLGQGTLSSPREYTMGTAATNILDPSYSKCGLWISPGSLLELRNQELDQDLHCTEIPADSLTCSGESEAHSSSLGPDRGCTLDSAGKR